MKLKQLFLLFFSLIYLLMSASLIQARDLSEEIVLRISSSEIEQMKALQTDGKVIDYGSFSLVVTTSAQLANLEKSEITYQQLNHPYELKLGGYTFDPLLDMPVEVINMDEKINLSDEGLHLVQFYGPTKSAWLDSLESNGFSIVQYIHPYTYAVWGDTTSLNNETNQSFVRWTGAYLPAYAVQHQFLTQNEDILKIRVMSVPQAGVEKTIQSIKALGGLNLSVNTTADPVFDLITFSIPGDQFQNIASLPGVYAVQPISTSGGDRSEVSPQINVNSHDETNLAFTGYLSWLDDMGLSGQDVIVAAVDSGIEHDHPDLQNRFLSCVGVSCNVDTESTHGTHTAGIIAGDASSGVTDTQGFLRGLGMAPGASLIDQLYSPTFEETGGMLTLMAESVRNGAVISGNSWGPSDSPLGYDMDTRLVDIGVRDADPDQAGNQPLSYILSIMNGGGGTSSQGTPDEAKNILSIGSTYLQNNNGTQRLDINSISSNSAHGPSLDGRIIPLMVAPGYKVDSTVTGASYALLGGTSMASPQVTGSAALFYERFRNLYGVDPSPALTKAAFLAVAHDLAGNQDADGNILGHPFDAKQGWGRLDAEAVLDPTMSVMYFDQGTRFDATGETFTLNISETRAITALRAMLVWTDAPGHGLGGDLPAWVNNLDLSITVDSQTYWGNNFGEDGLSIPGGTPDEMNNTEGIFLSAITSSDYEVTITAANIASDGVPNIGDETDQDFALVIYVDYEEVEAPYQVFIPLISH